MHTWLDPTPISPPDEFRNAIGGHPMVAEILCRRGYQQVAAAKAFLTRLNIPLRQRHSFPICYAPSIGSNKQDFGVRRFLFGATLMWMAKPPLHCLLRHCNHWVLRLYTIFRCALQNSWDLSSCSDETSGSDVKLLLTCDTGITAHEFIAYAQEHGVDVIVTDHHDLPPSLPPAFAFGGILSAWLIRIH